MNIQHSSRSDSWETPACILDPARRVLGHVDFDPASDEDANERVGACRFFTEEDDALTKDWPKHQVVFLNPPGGKRRNRSMTELFWGRLMEYRASGYLEHAIFLAFSLEAMQTTQRHKLSVADFPFCVPRRRIKFVDPTGLGRTAPSHSNVVVYVPGRLDKRDKFAAEFSTIGVVRL